MTIPVAKSSMKGNSFYRNVFASALMAAVLCSALMSWSSSRTLSFALGGTWRSANGDELAVVCEGGSAWTSMCLLRPANAQFDGAIRASPLNAGGWVAFLEANPFNVSMMYHRGKILTVVSEHQNGDAKSVSYIRDEVLTKDFARAVRTKGKYIAALFLIVGTYKWVQVSFFGAPRRRVRRF
ncbi:hypothetical protein ABB37_01372 [Leptomonas pyrrhocoris]|uniref:Uncharacterized protein n=1 Tax=Leptomonas pyrrhocoris TaxID=157538 RepID=A0A0N0DZ91_LEPPY|nr:hypothetical protein ABB37_01372 [Leptomonas pyrrhocoris]XP_015663362.1 hypothetical protein ABB37_01372 [Leptomonas pyrrhocoris]KPA84922.1 hypothetical protein ABB37_01372 [Leptomonas pyrrhocoris]KPA84923.1 hypothetical protein ABB37_01372 [Leptomonas pyrrhocoris]|eukprot:XP_015663361.1 hypothetical protein ABB37_01372 [Leptomonas pyrrhocoris]